MRGAIALVTVLPFIAAASHAQHQHVMPRQTLFTARANGDEVVPRSNVRSEASATGAFAISADAKRLTYRLTWDRLRSEKIDRIDLHDFGRGGVGKAVFALCGGGSAICPQARGGTVEGTWEIPPPLTRELGVERIYVDIHTSQSKDGEVRAQLLPMPWMIHSEQFLARMDKGTATLYITPFPDLTRVQFDVTIAGLPDGDAAVAIVDGRVIARLRVDGFSIRRRGGTISGTIAGSRVTSEMLSAIRGGSKPTLTVTVNDKIISSGTLVPVK